MADTVKGPYEQVRVVLVAVLSTPALQNGSGPFTRTLIVTDAIKDVKVSRALVEVHPEWAVERGPLAAAEHIRMLCKLYDTRLAEAHERAVAELRARLRDAADSLRQLGEEREIDELKRLPVPRRRSLVRRTDD